MALFCWTAPIEAAKAATLAVDAHWSETEKRATLTFDLSSNLTPTAFAMGEPNRIIVDIPETNFQIDPSVGRTPPEHLKSRIIRAFRFGQLAPGKSRIVIDLNATARVAGVTVRPVVANSEAMRLEIELESCDEQSFAAAVNESDATRNAAAPAAAAARPSAPAGLPVIVLDPGHGGVDGGANGPPGVTEKFLVFEFAREFARQIEATHKFKVVMTRAGDDFVSLGDRVRIARDANAAFMISLHADMLADAPGVSGATVYTLADRASDTEAARIAEHENAADKTAGVEGKTDDADVTNILFDLKRRETRIYAHIFSRDAVKALAGVAKLNRNPERSAGFVVLKAPDFPSVLIELGYLSSLSDVKALSAAEWRVNTAATLTAALVRFFDSPVAKDASGAQAVTPAAAANAAAGVSLSASPH